MTRTLLHILCIPTFLIVSAELAHSQDVLRAVGLRYTMRTIVTGPFDREIRPVTGFELLAGDSLLGEGKPTALYQNTSTRDLRSFRVRFRVVNSSSGEVIYNRTVCVDSSQLVSSISGIEYCDQNGTPMPLPNPQDSVTIPPGGYVKVKFSEMLLNPNALSNIGSLQFEAIVQPQACPSNTNLGDTNPLNDTSRVVINSIVRVSTSGVAGVNALFYDDASRFLQSTNGKFVPTPLLWSNTGAEIVDGTEVNNPPNPNSYKPSNNPTGTTLKSPVLKLNRLSLNNTEPTMYPGGDSLMSVPIDLTGKSGSVLVISYQRTGKINNIRKWAESAMHGPEHRVIGDAGTVLRAPDELIVDFANGSPDGISNVLNPTQWNTFYHKQGFTVIDNYAASIFGGGGWRKGLDSDGNPISFASGLQTNVYDDGKDERFKKLFIPIPDTIINSTTASKNFRFRLRVSARKHGIDTVPTPADDADNFFISSIAIYTPDVKGDIEVTSIQDKIQTKMIPLDQALNIPVSFTIANNSSRQTSAFTVKATVNCKNCPPNNPDAYTKNINIPSIGAMSESEFFLSSLDLRKMSSGKTSDSYDVVVTATPPSGDNDANNNQQSASFSQAYGDAIAYDSGDTVGFNDVTAYANFVGAGLSLPGCTSGAQFDDCRYGADNIGVGKLLMRFALNATDTVYGYQAYFGERSLDNGNITYSIMRDNSGILGNTVSGSLMTVQRGQDDRLGVTNGTVSQYSTVLLSSPLVLPPGVYWMSILQATKRGLTIGASARDAGTTIMRRRSNPATLTDQLMLARRFRKTNTAKQERNDFPFAFANDVVTNVVTNLAGDTISCGYPHLNSLGSVNNVPTFFSGTWIPMMRVYMPTQSASLPKPDSIPPQISQVTTTCAQATFHVTDSIIPTVTPQPNSQNVRYTLDTVAVEFKVNVKVQLLDSLKEGIYTVKAVGKSGKSTAIIQKIDPAPRTPPLDYNPATFEIITTQADLYEWYRNDTLIAGAHGNVLVINATAKYAVVITDKNGCKAKAEKQIEYSPVSVIEEDGLRISISPQPISDAFDVAFKTSTPLEISSIEISDLSGRLIKQVQLNSQPQTAGRYTVKTEELSRGVYVVRLVTNTRSWAITVVKE